MTYVIYDINQDSLDACNAATGMGATLHYMHSQAAAPAQLPAPIRNIHISMYRYIYIYHIYI